ncbi:hypothetical protein ACHAQA_004941 [Verticillium albo-atrum]
MISSRFFMLSGSGGTSRSHYVHQRLWNHCEVLIRRILLGQEKTSTSKTRSVGTVESLMLISDWHPRALHLPPETDGWDGMLISPAYDPAHRQGTDTEEPLIRWREDVFSPAERANRMSWMLLGMAANLAYELGIFSNPKHQGAQPAYAGEPHTRKSRAQKLLYAYVTQTATRLSYPPLFPESIDPCLRDTLLIEFHHLKACTAAISIQAVVARAASSGISTDANSEDVLSAFITARDAKFLQDVISASKTVLHLATVTDFRSHLPFAPARVKVTVISASVFLLKALSVGSTNTDVHAALQTLDQCTVTLKSSPPDDMDFALRYGALIEKHTAQFRAHLTSIRTPVNGEQSSRASFAANLAQGGVGIPPADSFLPPFGQQMTGVEFEDMDIGAEGDMWVALPFDSGIAPFSSGADQLSLGLDVDSLNFLWSLGNLPPMDQQGPGMS